MSGALPMHDPYKVEPRKPLTPAQRLKLFLAHAGKCCICGGKIAVGESWIDEHVRPLWLDGTNDIETNRAPAHASCAKDKTKREAGIRSKVRRVAAKHQGAHRSRNPMPGSKASKWRKRMDGTVERRED